MVLRILFDLFSGKGSVGPVTRFCHCEAVPLDLKDVSINCDVLDFDFKQYPNFYFDFIWASPPCIEYYIARIGS